MLQHYRGYIQSTVFVCGILYERFSANGMLSHRIGVNTGIGNEGDFIADLRNMTATAPVYDASQNLASLCLTSAYDVGRFVVRSLDMPSWPHEMSMCGERMTVNALIDVMTAVRGMCTGSLLDNLSLTISRTTVYYYRMAEPGWSSVPNNAGSDVR